MIMDNNILLIITAILALILTAVFFNAYALLALLIFLPFLFWRILTKKDEKARCKEHKQLTLEDAIKLYGEPDESILVDATRANEATGCILVYHKLRVLIVAGEPVNFDDITDVSSYNSATPYTIGQYQILLTTKHKDHRYIRLDAGLDAEWAKNVAMEIIDAMKWSVKKS